MEIRPPRRLLLLLKLSPPLTTTQTNNQKPQTNTETMKTKHIITVTSAIALLLSSCAADYSSTSVNDRRGRQLTSYGQVRQNDLQRYNEGSESNHQRNMRYNQRDEMLHPLKTINEAASLARGIGFNF